MVCIRTVFLSERLLSVEHVLLPCLSYAAQAAARCLIPGLQYLGFIGNALVRILFRQVLHKYQAVSAATSLDKVGNAGIILMCNPIEGKAGTAS